MACSKVTLSCVCNKCNKFYQIRSTTTEDDFFFRRVRTCTTCKNKEESPLPASEDVDENLHLYVKQLGIRHTPEEEYICCRCAKRFLSRDPKHVTESRERVCAKCTTLCAELNKVVG